MSSITLHASQDVVGRLSFFYQKHHAGTCFSPTFVTCLLRLRVSCFAGSLLLKSRRRPFCMVQESVGCQLVL